MEDTPTMPTTEFVISKKLRDEAVNRINQLFIENLVNASSGKEFADALLEWKPSGHFLSAPKEGDRCELCNTHTTKQHVVIENTINGNALNIGINCFGKFCQAISTGKVESALPSRSEHHRAVKKYLKDKTRKDKTFLGWFRETRALGALPESLVRIMSVIDAIGFPPTTKDVDELVSFYRLVRRFPCHSILDRDESYALSFFSHRNLVPAELTLDSAERLKKLLLLEKGRRQKSSELVNQINRRHVQLHAEFQSLLNREYPARDSQVIAKQFFDNFHYKYRSSLDDLRHKRRVFQRDIEAFLKSFEQDYSVWLQQRPFRFACETMEFLRLAEDDFKSTTIKEFPNSQPQAVIETLFQTFFNSFRRMVSSIDSQNGADELKRRFEKEYRDWLQTNLLHRRMNDFLQCTEADFKSAARKEFPNPKSRSFVEMPFNAFIHSFYEMVSSIDSQNSADEFRRRFEKEYHDWLEDNDFRQRVALHLLGLPMSPDPRRLIRLKFHRSRSGVCETEKIAGRSVCTDRTIFKSGWFVCHVLRADADKLWVQVLNN